MKNFKPNRVLVLLAVLAMAFVVSLAVVVGNRLSDQALAVLVGAVCGVSTAIPTSGLVVFVSYLWLRDRFGSGSSREKVPPVVVVAPGAAQWPTQPYPPQLPYGGGFSDDLFQSGARRAPRHFTVVGDGAGDEERSR